MTSVPRLHLVLLCLLALVAAGCGAGSPRFTTDDDTVADRVPVTHQLSGVASYYAEEFHARNTANGETYNMHGLTAAHRTLPFNTIVRVHNKRNGREVTVRINDRGPFKGDRVIDLSLEAAKRIGMIGSGTAEVELEVLEIGKP